VLEGLGAVLDRPERRTVDALLDLVTGWRDWGIADQHWGTRFMLDTELGWPAARPPIADG
jgi:hypothetical protein